MTYDSVDSSVRSRPNGVTQTTSNDSRTQSDMFSDNDKNSRNNNLKNIETQCYKRNNINNNNNQYSNENSVKVNNEKNDIKFSLWIAPSYNNEPFIPKIRWPDLCAQIFLHVGALYGLIFHLYAIKLYTLIWCKLSISIDLIVIHLYFIQCIG